MLRLEIWTLRWPREKNENRDEEAVRPFLIDWNYFCSFLTHATPGISSPTIGPRLHYLLDFVRYVSSVVTQPITQLPKAATDPFPWHEFVIHSIDDLLIYFLSSGDGWNQKRICRSASARSPRGGAAGDGFLLLQFGGCCRQAAPAQTQNGAHPHHRLG